MKKTRLFATIALALLVCAASITPALASGLNEEGILVAPDENNPVQAAVTKNLRMPIGTNVPDAVFNFIATPLSLDGDDGLAARTSMPPLNNLTITYAPGNTGETDPVTNITSIQRETGNIFAGVDFPHAGLYVYEITEAGIGSNPTIEANKDHEWLSYSDARYRLEVYVRDNAAGTARYVFALATRVERQDISGLPGGAKIDPTPGGDDDKYFLSQMVFTNDYVKTNGAVDPEDPDPVTESTLIVSKTVAGELASRIQHFNYIFTLNIPILVETPHPYYRAYVVENNVVIDPAENAAAALIGTDAGGKYIKISPTGETEFSLRHGQRLVFVDTPVGTGYRITEAAAINYIPSVVVTTNGTPAPTNTGLVNTALLTGPQLVGEAANRADFTNTRELVLPTGLSLNDLPFVTLIALGLGALVTVTVVKVRKRKQCD